MTRSLSVKVIYSFVTLILLMLIGMSVGASMLIRDYFITQKQQELITKAYEIAHISNDYFEEQISEEQFGSFLRSVDTLMDARVWVVDRSSQLVYMSAPDRGSSKSMEAGKTPRAYVLWDVVDEMINEIDTVFEGKVWTKSYYHPYYREDMLMVAVPLEQRDRTVIGAVMLSAPAKGIHTLL